MSDDLGDRMKRYYENRTRYYLPRRTYTVIRVDGRAFHTYCRGLEKPFDLRLMEDVIETARYLCQKIAGARLAYAQSDEVSVLLTDFGRETSDAWFDGNVQKLASVSASLATAKFNQLRVDNTRLPGQLAAFDARAFTIPDPVEVANYLIWRQRDATKNSISLVARAYLSHRDVQGRTGNELQNILWSRHQVNWNDFDSRFKRGTLVYPVTTTEDVPYVDRDTGEKRVATDVTRRRWITDAAERWSTSSASLLEHVPGLRSVTGDTPQRGEP